MNCRFCQNKLTFKFANLNHSPASNSYLKKSELSHIEEYYPLKVFTCEKCFLVQISESKTHKDIFNDEYAYFSSYSKSWLKHAKNYVDMIEEKLLLNINSYVTEIASNDGYLLQYFKDKNIPCIGIEPSQSTARVAKEKGINVIEKFFGKKLAKTLKKSDLILGNNVLAHVPDINDFVIGLKIALSNTGTITMEFPHLLNLIKENQFDTIYHEHYSYFSLYTVKIIFEFHKLKVYDVEEISTHGGSLRIYATHKENKQIPVSNNVQKLLDKEKDFGILNIYTYQNFQVKMNTIKYEFLNFLINLKQNNQTVIAYGAAAKGNTLLNYCGVKEDLIPYVVDKSPHKQGKYLPSSHIKIVDESIIKELKPPYILILPWNLKHEIADQLSYIREWKGQFITTIPTLEIF